MKRIHFIYAIGHDLSLHILKSTYDEKEAEEEYNKLFYNSSTLCGWESIELPDSSN